ncbi:MAG: PQQ-dependent sugar dehydrogenase [Myxococcales bacterium]|nr:PQQ-dependent sugar dehydrogenase [Myxococcales bacterium]MDH3842410.1 PQQ-dependent sugar dehydrogenase [Myxococcales bacterium]
MTRLLTICAGIVILLSSGVAIFAAGGLVAKYGWQPYASVHLFADKQLRAIKAKVKGAPSNESIVTTNLYPVRVSTSQTSLEKVGDHVAFAQLGSGYLVAKRGGELFSVEHSLEPILERQAIETRVPTNKERFSGDNSERDPLAVVQFGVKDILIRERPDGVDLYASHSSWDAERRCATLRLSKLSTQMGKLRSGSADTNWTTVFETEPCLELNEELDGLGGDFTFLQAGGRLAFISENELLLTVGDHYQDGLAGPDLPQDPESHIGKTVWIDLESGGSRVYSLGHRNPQGLYVDHEGTVWSTEHGPRGGDELNIIVDGANYGWPKVSYGLQYPGLSWPAPHWGNHDAFTLPLYAWVPSIATCNVIRLEGFSKFPQWTGDLIVGTLANRAVFRVRVRDNRVVLTERIEIGNRIRDLDQAKDGSLLLLTDDGDLITLRPLDSDDPGLIDDPVLRGQLLWAQCAQCHVLEHGSGHGKGPNLSGILGSRVARFDDFNYSSALKSLDTRWTEENLDAFLRSPQEFAPGNQMQFVGSQNPEDRAAIIAYLRSQ